MYTQKRREFEEKVQKTRNAESTLKAHSINTKEELLGIKKETEIQKELAKTRPKKVGGSVCRFCDCQWDIQQSMCLEQGESTALVLPPPQRCLRGRGVCQNLFRNDQNNMELD